MRSTCTFYSYNVRYYTFHVDVCPGDSANRPKSPSAAASANSNGNNGNGNNGNKSPDGRVVSLPPLLRTIIEQKSLEEREEKQHEPEPFQPMLEGRQGWPLLQMGYGPGWTDERKGMPRSLEQ